ncbi:MAG: OmpH family outer membrane protein [Deltaproteobacteria bacterium]|nr:OmpH family outer membrane protein [Deltaproteobacteria bacterium]
MKKYLFIAIVAGLVFSLSLGNPQLSRAEKIGFINVKEVLMTSDVGKATLEEFKKNVEKITKTKQDKEKELQKLKDQLDKQRNTITEKALKDMEQAYQKKFRDYQDLLKDANEDMQAREQEFLGKYYPELMKIVNSIGEKENFTLIIDISAVLVAYHAKDNNLTQRVTQEFNKLKKSR